MRTAGAPSDVRTGSAIELDPCVECPSGGVVAGMAPIEKVVFTSQDEVTAALINGEIDAMLADSPVTGFAIKLSRGELEPAGDVRFGAVRLAGG